MLIIVQKTEKNELSVVEITVLCIAKICLQRYRNELSLQLHELTGFL